MMEVYKWYKIADMIETVPIDGMNKPLYSINPLDPSSFVVSPLATDEQIKKILSDFNNKNYKIQYEFNPNERTIKRIPNNIGNYDTSKWQGIRKHYREFADTTKNSLRQILRPVDYSPGKTSL